MNSSPDNELNNENISEAESGLTTRMNNESMSQQEAEEENFQQQQLSEDSGDEADSENENENAVNIQDSDSVDNDVENPSANNDMENISLGDKVTIKHPIRGTTTGRIYYMDDEIIKVMPEGASDRIIPFTYDELAEYGEIEELHIVNGFIRQQQILPGQIMETFTANGDLVSRYTVIDVNEKKDRVTVKDVEGAEIIIPFTVPGEYVGVPSSILSGAEVIRVREPPQQVSEDDDTAFVANMDQEEIEVDEDEIDLNVVSKLIVQQMVGIEEIPSSERVFSDTIQKTDALTDIMSSLNDKDKKNENILRKVRTRIESFFSLRNELIEYTTNGIPDKIKLTSIKNLTELFNTVYVPLGRPVLNVHKKQYYYEAALDDEEGIVLPEDDEYMFYRVAEEELRNYMNDLDIKIGANAGADSNKGDNTTPQFWVWMQGLLDKYIKPWNSDKSTNNVWSTIKDTDFFRNEIPNFDTNPVVGFGVEALPEVSKKNPAVIEPPEQIPYSYMRTLGPTYRVDDKKNKRILINSESAPVRSYLLFPISEHRSIGTTRSGLLARDSEHSKYKPKWMSLTINELGGVQETPTSTGILSLGIDGNINDIPLHEYLETIPFTGYGLGDFNLLMKQYGMGDMEYNHSLAEMFEKRINVTKNTIYTYISILRKKLKEMSITTEENPLFRDEIKVIGEIVSEPILVNVLRDLTASSPLLSEVDIPRFAALLKYQPDLFYAVIGKQPTFIAKYRMLSNRDLYNVSQNIRKIKDKQAKTSGYAPTPNLCPHVAKLKEIYKLADMKDKVKGFVNFISKYQGKHVDNWIKCSKCFKNLICKHELIQLQQHLQPKEQKTLEKDLILNYYGPIMGNTYECKKCGQAIRTIEYDTNLEFDDEGRPMMGRSEMMDTEEEDRQKINIILSAKDGIERLKLNSELHKKIYEPLKEICIHIGIKPTNESYNRLISLVKTFMSQSVFGLEEYTEKEKKAKAKGIKLGKYDSFYDKHLVYTCAAAVLLEVQTHIPSYYIKYAIPGCDNPNFTGYPLEEGEGSSGSGSGSDETNRAGLKYITCAVLSVINKKSPWSNFSFPDIKDLSKRIDFVQKNIEGIFIFSKGVGMLRNSEVQNLLAKKKEYIIRMTSPEYLEKRPKDILPQGFLPKQFNNINEVIIDGSAKTDEVRSELWVKIANKYAKDKAIMIKDSPYSETTCCLNNITEPGGFWKKIEEFPKLGVRTIIPVSSVRGTRIGVQFEPRPLEPPFSETMAPMQMFRVFTNVCYKGPHIGHRHEFNSFKKCYWCDFEYPSKLDELNKIIEMTGLSKKEESEVKKRREEMVRAAEEDAIAMMSAQVEINEQTFTQLLDDCHKAFEVDKYKLPIYKNGIDRLETLKLIDPSPSSEWIDIHLQNMLDELRNYKMEDGNIKIVEIVSEISNVIKDAENDIHEKIRRKYGRENVSYNECLKALKSIKNDKNMLYSDLIDIILSYFITPFNRILSRLDYNETSKIQLQYELDDADIKDISNNILAINQYVLRRNFDIFEPDSANFAKEKLKYFVKQLSSSMFLLKQIAPGTVPGGERLMRYIIHYCIFIPLKDLFNPTFSPPGVQANPISATESSDILVDLIRDTCIRLNIEIITYSEEQIRQEIEIRREKEANTIIKDMDEMTLEDRAVELMMKRLGLGRWAVGGTKAIRQYDPEQQERERIERTKAGIIDWDEGGIMQVRGEGDIVEDMGSDDF